MDLLHFMNTALEVVMSKERGKGLCWAGCVDGNKGVDFTAALKRAVDKRLEAMVSTSVELAGDIKSADEKLLAIAQQWNCTLTLPEVTRSVDNAARAVAKEVVAGYSGTGSKGHTR